VRLLVLSAQAVHDVLPYGECAPLVRDGLAALARGQVHQPLRTVIRPPGTDALMALMPCVRPAGPATEPSLDAAFSLKAICIFPGNPALGKDAHQGGVLLSSPETGEPLALINASALTEIRTAAVSVVATSLLARPDASELAIIGTGVQARAHAIALAGSWPLTGIRIAGRVPGRGSRAAAELAGRAELAGVPVVGCASAAEAVAGAGIVVTATTAAAPVLQRAWLDPGVHINAVGACLPESRELDSATVADAAVFVDSRESALAESGDIRLALADQAIGAGHIRAEIGEVLTGAARGRTDDSEITVFESLGLAVEDLAAALGAYRRAAELGAGTWVDF
jgi:ornithine cyclodeaminase/alanine dehydrogenase-like protein (mu-crystallin family)